jgi:Flagellin and related hook-associated proteins
MKICYNTSAMIANNALNRNDSKLAKSLQRLSSGLKVVEAKDNPAGMAMGKRMNAQLTGIAAATQNSSDAISVIETADGALSEIHDILQRMNELAVKSSNGTWSDNDRATIQEEIKQLKAEITRIASDTQFNGETLLDGNFDMKGYTDNPNVKVGYYSDQVITGFYQISMGATINLDANGDIQDTVPSSLVGQAVTGLTMAPDAKITEVNGNILKIKSDSKADFEINLKINGMGGATSVNITNMELNITGKGAMTMQTGAQEGQILDIRIPTVSLEELGIKNLDLTTAESSWEGIDSVKGAISYISSVRSRLGAYQNRLEHTISNLDITDENMTGAYSRIMDVDMAEEMTEYTTMQVISQASMSMLAQANERPAQVLQLLQ